MTITRAPFHVLMTADATGEVWSYAMALMQALRPAGVTFTLAVMGPAPSAAQLAEADAMDHVRVRAHVRTAGRWLQQLIARIAPDIIHINGHTRIVAPTQAMASLLRQEYAYNGPITVIAHGLPPAPKVQKESCIFAGGRVCDEGTNLALVDEIAPSLAWPVIAAGRIDCDCAVLPRHIWHLGPIDHAELRHRLARAAIYVHPARYEPFGLSVLEAAHAGCALVLGDIPSLREVWGDAAIYVPPDDRAALRQTLANVIANGTLRAELASAARARALEYRDRQMADQYVALYQTLQAHRPVRRDEVMVLQQPQQEAEVVACGS